MIGAGGTGGHVYPALAVAEALRRRAPGVHELTFVGTVGGGGFEHRLVKESGVQLDHYAAVMAGPIVGVGLLRAIASAFKIMIGFGQSLALLLKHKPAAILLTGGWANVPLALAAYVLRIPQLVYLPDIEPGRTIQLLSRFAQRVATTVSDSEQYFRPGQVVVTGYPLREIMTAADRDTALQHFGLDAGRKTLLVFGGSRGARTINIAINDILADLLDLDIQIIHVTGELDWEQTQARTSSLPNVTHYHTFPYLHDNMGLALAAADIVICRSGASTLGELPLFGVAAILVPYPHAWRYQKTNADYLADRGAAVHMSDDAMATDLLPLLRNLLADEALLAQMQAAARALAVPDGADNVADALLTVVEAKHD